MNKNEERMHAVLRRIWPEHLIHEQFPLMGKTIDFVVDGLLIEANGEWWHGQDKIVPCDVRKLNTLLEAGHVVLGFWDWRIEKHPDLVERLVRDAAEQRKITVWDWHQSPGELTEKARENLRRLWAVHPSLSAEVVL